MELLITNKHSKDWKSAGSLLVYKSPHFQFKPDVIVVELDGCLISPVSVASIYNQPSVINSTKPPAVHILDEEFISQLKKQNFEKSIIVLSNQVLASNKQIIHDFIKHKFEKFMELCDVPMLCVFAISPNCFMKPHTGLWRFVKSYYRRFGNGSVINEKTAMLVSNNGGIVMTNNKGEVIGSSNDIDRAFAHNINIKYISIEEFSGYDISDIKFVWDNEIIEPAIRRLYADHIKTLSQPNLFFELNKFGDRDVYVIMLSGPPRSGKTTVANALVDKWRNSEFGKHNEVYSLDSSMMGPITRSRLFKKHIKNRISVILDGGCHQEGQRRRYLAFIKNKNIPVLFIEVTCGFEMAKVFNHAHVEDSSDGSDVLYKNMQYMVYKSTATTPQKNENLHSIVYYPPVEEKKSVMEFRY